MTVRPLVDRSTLGSLLPLIIQYVLCSSRRITWSRLADTVFPLSASVSTIAAAELAGAELATGRPGGDAPVPPGWPVMVARVVVTEVPAHAVPAMPMSAALKTQSAL